MCIINELTMMIYRAGKAIRSNQTLEPTAGRRDDRI